MIKHQINDHAGNRDIQPHWQCPARKRTMTQKIATQRAAQSNDDERHDHHGQNRVRGQDREIDGPRNSLPAKPRSAMMLVINDVGNQKKDRGRQRCQLTTSVRQHSSAANEKVTGRQENETGRIKRRVKMRQDAVEIRKHKTEESEQ